MQVKTLLIRILKWTALVSVVLGGMYGASRLYYKVTDGFTVGNITSDFSYDPRWDVTALSPTEKVQVDSILSQPFTYLGKGCQAYVFLSQDGNYILKFFKYQRFRPQAWLDHFAFIPAVDKYRLGKIDKKRRKLEGVFSSWKVAYENLKPETQLVYVHLNKSHDLKKTLVIYDKMGFEHKLDADQMEFLVQRKATMLCPHIKELMERGNAVEAQMLLTRIIDLIVSEYKRGFADNDHALMQNTGVYNGYPIHIDVGQFMIRENAKQPDVYKQELFNKTYKFRKWLKKQYPELLPGFEEQLREVIGSQFDHFEPHFKPHEWVVGDDPV